MTVPVTRAEPDPYGLGFVFQTVYSFAPGWTVTAVAVCADPPGRRLVRRDHARYNVLPSQTPVYAHDYPCHAYTPPWRRVITATGGGHHGGAGMAGVEWYIQDDDRAYAWMRATADFGATVDHPLNLMHTCIRATKT